MDNYDKIIKKIFDFKESNAGITESDISRILIEESVPLILVDDILETLESQLANINDTEADKIEYTVPRQFKTVLDRVKQYNLQQMELANMSSDIVKKNFIFDFSKAKIQTTYMPVTILAFLESADENGTVSIDSIADYFTRFYNERKEKGLIVERSDSIFAKTVPSKKEIKALILFNPLGRSCLIKYFVSDKINGTVSMISNLWKSLSLSDAAKIRVIANSMIQNYYRKLKK